MYAPLNIKTCNSLLKSMINIDDLVKVAKENNIQALTITDDNMYGVLDFYKACTHHNIKPIIGLELSLPEKIIFYAMNYEGYKNLMKLTTIKSEKDSSGQDVNALQFWLPLNVRQGLLWYSDNVLDLYINININNFTSTSFLPFKILDKNNNWVDSFTTSAFSVDITASSVIKFLYIINFPVSFPIINLYQN